MRFIYYYSISFIIILLDQWSKLATYFSMTPGEEFSVLGDWFRIHYLLNPGMAFGLEINLAYGKPLLTIIRLLATLFIFGYIFFMIKNRKSSRGILFFCFILGGAIGNLIDSVFYGVFLENNAIDSTTSFLWLQGQVIDMLYFPIFDFYFPQWIPFVGGQYFMFFSPIFNVADSFIFIGFVLLLLFHKKK